MKINGFGNNLTFLKVKSLCGCAEVHIAFDFVQKQMLPLVLLSFLSLIYVPHGARARKEMPLLHFFCS